MTTKPVQPFLEVEHFAQIRKARIEFGDLTVLVGAQATAKSLLLQLFKLAMDGPQVSRLMLDAGISWRSKSELIGRYLGEGMESAWRDRSVVRSHEAKQGHQFAVVRTKATDDERVFYIPAHRAQLLIDGWPLRFERLTESTPFVARLFSDALFRILANRKSDELDRRLSRTLHGLVDKAIYHGGNVTAPLHGSSRRLEMKFKGGKGIPFQVWTTGQREFTPLLLGLYLLSPPTRARRAGVEWVVIEEPELGLHPRGIEVVMLMVLDLLSRGYRVIISTHSPVILELVWAIQRLAERGGRARDLLEAFHLEERRDLAPLATRALKASHRVFALHYVGELVESRDISELDPGSDSSTEAFWGGLTEFGSRIADVVTRLSR